MKKTLTSKILICPKCNRPDTLIFDKNVKCKKCAAKYRMNGDQIIFKSISAGKINDPLDKIKFFFKKFPKVYYFAVNLISPVYFDSYHLNGFLKKQLKSDDLMALNVGSGNTNLSEKMINVDILAYKNVDVVCNIEKLPFKDRSVDLVVNIAVLEHIPRPEEIIVEISRVLKKGGKVYSFFPFIQGFHASPYDYQRRTVEGLKELYRDFKTVEIRMGEGPTSGFLWVFQEYIAILLSFGIKPLYLLLYVILMIGTFPLKYLDILLIHNKLGKNIAGGFIFVGEKR